MRLLERAAAAAMSRLRAICSSGWTWLLLGTAMAGAYGVVLIVGPERPLGTYFFLAWGLGVALEGAKRLGWLGETARRDRR